MDPLGPVFVSYRSIDGTTAASDVAWALRATGVPVWHDEADLLPGDTELRLSEALSSGLSGAVLVVTPDIAASTVVRQVELPALLDLEAQTEFSLAVASVMEDPSAPGHLDFEAPDRILGQPQGTLKRLKQYRLVDPVEITKLAHALAMRRVEVDAVSGGAVLVIDIQSRLVPIHEAPRVPLVVRTDPPDPGHRAPPRRIWTPYAAFLANLPRLVSMAGTSEVEVRGGSHLSIAFALGAALPVTTAISMSIADRSGKWESEELDEAPSFDFPFETGIGDRLAVYVDLTDSPSPVDSFADHVAVSSDQYGGIGRIRLSTPQRVSPAAGGSTVVEVARQIREWAHQVHTNRVDLFLRTPFPIAVLLGRMLNTLAVDPYEWEDGDTPPRYVRTVTVQPGVGGGPIILGASGE